MVDLSQRSSPWYKYYRKVRPTLKLVLRVPLLCLADVVLSKSSKYEQWFTRHYQVPTTEEHLQFRKEPLELDQNELAYYLRLLAAKLFILAVMVFLTSIFVLTEKQIIRFYKLFFHLAVPLAFKLIDYEDSQIICTRNMLIVALANLSEISFISSHLCNIHLRPQHLGLVAAPFNVVLLNSLARRRFTLDQLVTGTHLLNFGLIVANIYLMEPLYLKFDSLAKISKWKRLIETFGLHDFLKAHWHRLRVSKQLRVYLYVKAGIFVADALVKRSSQLELAPLAFELLNHLTENSVSIFALTSVVSYGFYLYSLVIKRILFNAPVTVARNQPHFQMDNNNNNEIPMDPNENNELSTDISELSAILFIILCFQSGLSTLEDGVRPYKLFKNMLLLFIAMLHYYHKIVDQKLMQLNESTLSVNFNLINTISVASSGNKTLRLVVFYLQKHGRVLFMAMYLFVMPNVILVYLWRRCEISTWLLAASCFNLELIIKMLVTLSIYLLFIVDSIRLMKLMNRSKEMVKGNFDEDAPNQSQSNEDADTNQSFDDTIYYIRSFGCVMEFIFALFLLFNSAFILIFESYGSIRTIMMCLHAYFHIWVQAHKGWASFVKRNTAASKIKRLPIYVRDERDNELCAICYYEISSGETRITACKHLFHSICLRKWLYVQDTCPMCHAIVSPTSNSSSTQTPNENQNNNNNNGNFNNQEE